MSLTVTPAPRNRFGITVVKYATDTYYGGVAFNRAGKFVGASKENAIGSTNIRWLDNPEDLPAGVYDAARAAYLETL